MILGIDGILLGSTLVLDAAALVLCAIVTVLTLLLLRTRGRSLRRGMAARIAFGLVFSAALLQCLTGELLLFLAGGATLGYALLALGLATPRCLTPNHAIAAAALLVAGDLALLELAMLLGKSVGSLTFDRAGDALRALRGDTLAEFCLILGFGSRLGLPALCLPAGRASRTQFALLPGWLLLAVCASAGAVRLSCTGDFGAGCAAPLRNVLWWVPLLALFAWLLPLWTPRMLRALVQLGAVMGDARDAAVQRVLTLHAASGKASAALLRSESLLSRWPLALAAGILAALAIAVALRMAVTA